MPEVEPLFPVAAQPTVTTAEQFACEMQAGGRGAAWVSIRGELDLASAPEFRNALDEALGRALLVIIDLRALTFIDSAGLHAIIDADARARGSGHRLVLIRGSGQVDRLFKLVALTDRLRIVDLPTGPPASSTTPDSSAIGAAC